MCSCSHLCRLYLEDPAQQRQIETFVLVEMFFVLTGVRAASECETYAAEDVLRMCPTVRAPQSDGVISRAAEERSRRQTSTQIPRNIWEHLWRDEREKV